MAGAVVAPAMRQLGPRHRADEAVLRQRPFKCELRKDHRHTTADRLSGTGLGFTAELQALAAVFRTPGNQVGAVRADARARALGRFAFASGNRGVTCSRCHRWDPIEIPVKPAVLYL